MLKIDRLSIVHRRDLTPIVRDLSLTLRPGERLALIGEEGDGKSTLLRCVAGDESVREYAEVTGFISTDRSRGYLPQELPARARGMTAYEYFCESDAFAAASPGELGALAARLSLPADAFYSDQTMAAFSGGERVKLQLARLLLGDPELLLLDEPTNDLDLDASLWLQGFLSSCPQEVIFVSHDEALLSAAATGVLLLERLRHRQLPRWTLERAGYEDFVRTRAATQERQAQLARKEREEFARRQSRYEQIRAKVERDQRAISRQDPAGGRLLKKKMHAVLSMGRRFEREREALTPMPESEEAIFARLSCAPLPEGKVVLDVALPALRTGDRLLAQNVRLTVRGRERVGITGANGAGKSTLLRELARRLRERSDVRVFYLPQDPNELLPPERTPVSLLCDRGGEALSRARTELGSLRFTAGEMEHPCAGLSGGQKAKLLFLLMARSGANVLLLDEPTRNLSPLSGPVIRALLRDFGGCMIAISHDRFFLQEACTRLVRLTPQGLTQMGEDALQSGEVRQDSP